MFDLHCHLLPAIDDGAQSLEEALALARLAIKNGITHSVLTPHFHPGRWENQFDLVSIKCEQFRTHLRAAEINLKVAVAGEVRAGPEAMSLCLEGQLPFVGHWQNMPVVLLEFSHGMLPVGSEKLIAWLVKHGVRPMIAHPERNKDIIRSFDKINPLIAEGALLQVTADAVCGDFGPMCQLRAREMLERGWVTILASDAHSIDHRPPQLEPGRIAAAHIVGETESWRLVRDRPAEISAALFNNL